jgi:hypothetical protein
MKAWQGSLGVSAHHGITSPDYVVFARNHQEDSQFLHHLLRSERMPGYIRPSPTAFARTNGGWSLTNLDS